MAKDQSQDVPDGTPRHIFNMIVRDFDRAVGTARFSGIQTFLIQRAREESWVEAALKQRRDPIPFRFDLKALAAFVGCNLSALYDAWHRLLEARVFYAIGDGFYLIQRYFENWVKPGTDEPLLTAHIIKDCLRYRVDRKAAPVRKRTQPVPSEQQMTFWKNPNSDYEKPENSSQKTKRATIEDRPRRNRLQIQIPDTPQPPEGGECVRVVDSNGEEIQLPADVKNDPVEIAALEKWAADAFPMANMEGNINAYKATFPVAWMREILEDALAWTEPPRTFKPILNKLREWQKAKGRPGGERPRRNGSAPSKPTPPLEFFKADTTPKGPIK